MPQVDHPVSSLNTNNTMRRFVIVSVGLLLSATAALTLAQTSRAPRTPAGKARFSEVPGLDAAATAPGAPADESEKPIKSLNGIIVLGAEKDIEMNGVKGVSGVQVRGPDFLKGPDFPPVLSSFLGRPAGEPEIRALQTNIVVYCRMKGHPIVDVFYKDGVVIEDGIIQIAVIEGKLGSEPSVTNAAPQWFYSAARIRHDIRLHAGDPILERPLVEDINWLNRNPFREVSVGLKPYRSRTTAPTATQEDVRGKVDLQVQVKERFPLSVFTGYENSGNRIVGRDRFLGGGSWGNVFGSDQILSYQFTSDIDFYRYEAHAGSYWIPLPWRHVLTLYGYHADLKPDLSVLGAGAGTNFAQTGESSQASLQYGIPLPGSRKVNHELSIGFDYKSSDSDLDFISNPALFQSKTPVDVFQWSLGYRVELSDSWGATAVGAQGVYSPGGLSSDNSTTAFDKQRFGAKAEYLYGRFDALRATKLPLTEGWRSRPIDACFSWVVRGTAQVADGNLLPSEQLGVGGYSTVRGYEERAANGDEGWIISNELLTPRWRLPQLFPDPSREGNRLQLLGFVDYGATRFVNRGLATDIPADMVSVGCGLRFSVGRNFALRVDFGHQLQKQTPELQFSASTDRLHVGAELRF